MRRSTDVMIGPWPVSLLLESTKLSEPELRDGASKNTLALADTAGTVTRKRELLRSRWLLRDRFEFLADPERSVDGNLIWPTGVSGSISHKDGHISASVGEVLSIGIDLERSIIPVPVISRVLSPEELESLAGFGSEATRGGVGFASKEAIFKAVFPLTGKRFWFEDATLSHVSSQNDGHSILTATIGPRAGGPSDWDRRCSIYVRSVTLDQQDYWLAVCAIQNACFNTVAIQF